MKRNSILPHSGDPQPSFVVPPRSTPAKGGPRLSRSGELRAETLPGAVRKSFAAESSRQPAVGHGAVGSVKGPSPGRTATGEMRRNRPFVGRGEPAGPAIAVTADSADRPG